MKKVYEHFQIEYRRLGMELQRAQQEGDLLLISYFQGAIEVYGALLKTVFQGEFEMIELAPRLQGWLRVKGIKEERWGSNWPAYLYDYVAMLKREERLFCQQEGIGYVPVTMNAEFDLFLKEKNYGVEKCTV